MADHRVELLIDDEWTAIRTLESDRVRLSGGRSKDAGDSDPSRIECTIINQDGELSPRNPRSSKFGKIGQGTLMRVTVPQSTHLLRSGFNGRCETPDHASLDTTDLDLRIDFQVDTLFPNVGATLVGKYVTTGNQRSWIIGLNDYGYPFFRWSPDGTLASAQEWTHDVRMPLDAEGRATLRVYLDADNGASGSTLRFYYSFDGVNGTFTQLGNGKVFSLTPVFNSTAPVVIGYTGVTFGNHPMKVHGFQMRATIGGTVTANPDFSLATPGSSTLVDSTGKTWTVNSGAWFADYDIRGIGELAKWPTRWTITEALKTAPVQASGLSRRLSKPQAKLRSPLFREAVADDNLPRMVEYWSGEDGSDATQLASGIVDGPPMLITGSPSLAASSRIPGSEPLVTLATGSTLTGVVRSHLGTGTISLRLMLDVPTGGIPADVVLAEISCAGATGSTRVKWWRLIMKTSGSMQLVGLNSGFVQIATGTSVAYDVAGRRQMFAINVTQNGANIDWSTFARRIEDDLSVVQVGFNGTFNSVTLGRSERLTIAPNGDIDGVTVGHFMLGTSTSLAAGIDTAIVGNAGETAANRIGRVGQELGHRIRFIGVANNSQPMGPQPADTALNIYRECAEADGGILYEPRDEFGFEYRSRDSIYNSPAVELTYDEPGESPDLEPDEPGDDLVNDYTVTRRGGSFYRAVLESGALSVQEFPDGVGPQEDSDELNIRSDADLFDVAWWEIHRKSWDEFRYQTVTFNLAKAVVKGKDALAFAIAHRAPGDRIVISNPPADLPPWPIDLLVQGWSEELGEQIRDFEVNTSPGRPWVVGVAGETPADSDGTTLTAGIDADDTTFQWDVVGTPWAEDSLYPLMMVFLRDGREIERFEVTNIVGTGSTQTVTATRGTDGGWATSHPAGTEVRLFNPLRVAR